MAFEKDDAIERFSEGLKIAVDKAIALQKLTKSKEWGLVARNLNALRLKGKEYYDGAALTRQQSLDILDKIVDGKKD